jgi:hypothetical protein
VEDLFKEYSDVPRSSMGLSETWTNHPIWNPISKS